LCATSGSTRHRIDDAAAQPGVSSNALPRLENGRPVGTDRLFRVLSGFGIDLLLTDRSDTSAEVARTIKSFIQDRTTSSSTEES
jgi:hypothetical protein